MQPKPEYRLWWANFLSYQHVAIYIGYGSFLQAFGPGMNSGIMYLSSTIDISKMENILILRMNLTDKEKKKLVRL